MNLRDPMPARSAVLAGVLWLAAMLGFGAALDGYSQRAHPVALLGAKGIAHAAAFDVFGFVVPGLLMAFGAIAMRRQLDGDGWGARIGAQLLLLSALAFAAQGLLPLDPSDPGAVSSRLHATAWSLWWIAWLSGAALLALGARGARIAAVACAGIALLISVLVSGGIGQRVAIIAWFALAGLAGRAAGRRAGGGRSGSGAG